MDTVKRCNADTIPPIAGGFEDAVRALLRRREHRSKSRVA